MMSFFPRDLLNEIWDLTESVSEGFPTYFERYTGKTLRDPASIFGVSNRMLVSYLPVHAPSNEYYVPGSLQHAIRRRGKNK